MGNDKSLEFINPWRLFTGAMIPNWLLERPEVTQGAKLCYARLCQYAGRKGECFPKQRTLGNELGVKPRQIRKYLDELESLKLIKAFKVEFQGQNVYKFFYHSWMDESTPKRHSSATLERHSSATLERHSSATLYNIRESILRESTEVYCKRVNDFFKKSDQEWIEEIKKAYPKINLTAEFKKMNAWLISNPEKQKKNFKRFAVNWLNHSPQEEQKLGNVCSTGTNDVYLNEKLGRHAPKEAIKAVLHQIPENLWGRVEQFLQKRYPDNGSQAFMEAEREFIAEARNGKEALSALTAGVGK